jgi:hypothetical protein
MTTAEGQRLLADARREQNWKRWGPYLAERQWGTVREDYSADADVWNYFTHDDARSRAYRWGEDGLLGICDRECRLCFAVALWNGKDSILKERLFGVNGHEGNHGEDVKECYFYVDSTPTHSYMKALYKYPQAAFPYKALIAENGRRGRREPEYEILDTGVFDDERYFDVVAEYAKEGPNDILIRLTVVNRGPAAAPLTLLPTLWFRNSWSWGRSTEKPPAMSSGGADTIVADHPTLGRFRLRVSPAAALPRRDVSSSAAKEQTGAKGAAENKPVQLFTDNDTNCDLLFGSPSRTPYVKDAFHRYVVDGEDGAVNLKQVGTKAAFLYEWQLAPGAAATLDLRLSSDDEAPHKPFARQFDATFELRKREADEFYDTLIPRQSSAEEYRVARQAYAGLLWTKQAYHYAVREWLEGDPAFPPPPPERWNGRNHDWQHLYNRDVISMPDKWEYPWYAAWDVAFQMVPFARLDPQFAKDQLILLLREWYMHPNGQIPAYEFEFGDVNPPMHAWAAWRVYKLTGHRGARDRLFLERVFHKLLVNFSWWVNRKDADGNNIFGGGFLGLDNIGVFDRSRPLPGGQYLEQADGTAWMAFYASTMLSIAVELAAHDPAYEDMASKFFEHFVAIADAMNTVGGTGLWDDEDGFYYDQLSVEGVRRPLRVRSIVGLICLIACENVEQATIDRLPAFKKRMAWFLENREDLAQQLSYMRDDEAREHHRRLLAIPSRERLTRVLRYVLDEKEFLSPFGVRSLSRVHADQPFTLKVDGAEYSVRYTPGESDSALFGGNSNWRGPIWFPINYLLIEALERYHHYYGDSLKVECPTGSGNLMDLDEVSRELAARLCRIFLPDAAGRRACHGDDSRFAENPNWRDLLLFHEYFNGDSGRGHGASHQTGWTALVARCLEKVAVPHAVSRPSEILKAIAEPELERTG